MRRLIVILAIVIVGSGCGDDDRVGPGTPDSAPSILSISPAPWTVVSDTTTIEVIAEDADTVAFYQGADMLGTATAPPFAVAWNTLESPNGVLSITIHATNQLGPADTAVTYMVDNVGGERVVVVFPRQTTLGPQGSMQFSAEVLGSEDTRVTWDVHPIYGAEAGADLGVIDSTGFYRAPRIIPPSGEVAVAATTVESPGRTDEAVVSLTQGIVVKVTSVPETVYLGRTFQLEATVHGTEDQRVTWSVVEGASHGTVDETGLYTAPAVMPGDPQVTFRAVSLADPEESDTGTGLLHELPVVAIGSHSAAVAAGGTTRFSATVANVEDQTVLWSVVGGAEFGIITPEGIYKAPVTLPDPAEATIRARSAVDDLSADSVSVELLPAPPDDVAPGITETFWLGYNAAIVSDQVSGAVLHALELARQANGGESITTGTLNQKAEEWVFSAIPDDRFLIVPLSTPVWSVEVLSFGRSPANWPDEYYPERGYGYLDTLDCLITIDGHTLHLTTEPLAEAPQMKPACVAMYTDFQRTLQGEIGSSTGGVWTLDLQHEGHADYGSCGFETDGTVVGTMATDEGLSAILDWTFCVGGGTDGMSSFVIWELAGGVTATAGPLTYAWSGVDVRGYGGAGYYVKVVSASRWSAKGAFTRNGESYGEMSFDRPVVDRESLTANARIEFVPGYNLVLVPPKMPDWHGVETVVPVPFPSLW